MGEANGFHDSCSKKPGHFSTLLARAKDVPPRVLEKVGRFVSAKYAKLSEKYGPTGAKAVLAATILLLPVPLPGTTFLPIALAESARRLGLIGTRKVKEGMGIDAETAEKLEELAKQAGLSVDELIAAAREIIQEAQEAESTGDNDDGDYVLGESWVEDRSGMGRRQVVTEEGETVWLWMPTSTIVHEEYVTEANRGHLVPKRITNKAGRQQTVWVNPGKGKHAGTVRPKKSADEHPVREAESRVVKIISDPSKASVDALDGLQQDLEILPRDRIRNLAKQFSLKAGKDKMGLIADLMVAVKAQNDPDKATGAALEREQIMKEIAAGFADIEEPD